MVISVNLILFPPKNKRNKILRTKIGQQDLEFLYIMHVYDVFVPVKCGPRLKMNERQKERESERDM